MVLLHHLAALLTLLYIFSHSLKFYEDENDAVGWYVKLHILYFLFDLASHDLYVIQSYIAGMQIFRKLKYGCWKSKVLHSRQRPFAIM